MASRVITRTAVGSAIQTARGLGISHTVLDYTTLNQAINEPTIVQNLPSPLTRGMYVLPAYNHSTDSAALAAQYIVIGNYGHKNIEGASTPGVPYSVPVEHAATDTGLFHLIPFVVVPADVETIPAQGGLDTTERQKYALRRTLLIDGVLYVAYYARKLDYQAATPIMQITNVVDGVETTAEFVPTMNNLRPVHPTVDVSYSGSYVNITTPVSVVFNEKQIAYIKDACRLLYGNENYAIISEIAICSAVTKPVTHRFPNSGTQTQQVVPNGYATEAVACQVVMHITTYVPINYAEREYKIDFDFGASEPLFGVHAGS